MARPNNFISESGDGDSDLDGDRYVGPVGPTWRMCNMLHFGERLTVPPTIRCPNNPEGFDWIEVTQSCSIKVGH